MEIFRSSLHLSLLTEVRDLVLGDRFPILHLLKHFIGSSVVARDFKGDPNREFLIFIKDWLNLRSFFEARNFCDLFVLLLKWDWHILVIRELKAVKARGFEAKAVNSISLYKYCIFSTCIHPETWVTMNVRLTSQFVVRFVSYWFVGIFSKIWFSVLVWFKYTVGLNKVVTSIFSMWECELLVKDKETQFPSSLLVSVLTHCIILLKSFKFRWNGPLWSWWDKHCPSVINVNLLIC